MISILVAIVSLLSCAVRNIDITQYQVYLMLFAVIIELVVEVTVCFVTIIIYVLRGDEDNDWKNI